MSVHSRTADDVQSFRKLLELQQLQTGQQWQTNCLLASFTQAGFRIRSGIPGIRRARRARLAGM